MRKCDHSNPKSGSGVLRLLGFQGVCALGHPKRIAAQLA
jgi:hypothetical protein